VMPAENVEGSGADAHGTEGTARHRRNSHKQSTSSEHTDTAAYTEEQSEAVKRYKHFAYVCLLRNLWQYLYFVLVEQYAVVFC